MHSKPPKSKSPQPKWLRDVKKLVEEANLLPEDEREEAFRTATLAGLVGVIPRMIHQATLMVTRSESTTADRKVGFEFLARLHESMIRSMKRDKKKAGVPAQFPGFGGMQPILGSGANGTGSETNPENSFEIPFIRKIPV